MKTEILLTGQNKSTKNLKAALTKEGYEIFSTSDLSDLNLHNFEDLYAILDVHNLTDNLNELESLKHNSEGIKRLLELASANNVPYFFVYPSNEQPSSLNLGLEFIKQYHAQTNTTICLVEVGQIYSKDFIKSKTLKNYLASILHWQPIVIDNEDELIELVHLKDFTDAIVSIVKSSNEKLPDLSYCIKPEDSLTQTELAYFLADLIDAKVSVQYKDYEEKIPFAIKEKDDNSLKYPDGWSPQISLETGLNELLDGYSLRSKGDEGQETIRVLPEIENEIPTDEFDSLEIPPLNNLVGGEQEEFSLVYFESPETEQEATVESQIKSEEISALTDKTINFTKPAKQIPLFKPGKKTITILFASLMLALMLPSLIYSYNVYNGLDHLKKAKVAMDTGNLSLAKEESNSTLSFLAKTERVPEPIKTIAEVLPNKNVDFPETINISNRAANTIINLATLKEYLEGSYKSLAYNDQVLGASTSSKFDTKASETIALLSLLEKDSSESVGNTLLSAFGIDIGSIVSEKTGLAELVDINESLPILLGLENPQSYLLVLQNENELRASGGNIEIIGTITIDKGKIAINKLQSAKEINSQIELNGIETPSPALVQLTEQRDVINIGDTNWNPDFTKASKEILALYKQIHPAETDGVIAINYQFIKNLLESTGEISLPKYKEKINAENIEQKIAFYKTNPESNPDGDFSNFEKEILNEIANRLSQLTDITKFSKPLEKSLLGKDLIITHNSPRVQGTLNLNNWQGKVLDSKDDYLYIVETNLGNNSINGKVTKVVDFKSALPASGEEYTRELSLKYKNDSDEDYLNHIQIVVPQDAFLDQAFLKESGDNKNITRRLSAYKLGNKTVYTTEILVGPNKEVSFEMSYKTEPKVYADKMNFLIQKQPGIGNERYNVQFNYPNKEPFFESFELASDKTISFPL